MIGGAAFLSTITFYKTAFSEYNTIRLRAARTKGRYIAQGGLYTMIRIIEKGQGIYLDQIERVNGLPLTWGGGQVIFSVTEETGKFNLNYLVNSYDQQPNIALRDMVNRLSEYLGINYERWDAVVDWIDEDNTPLPFGFEINDYRLIDPMMVAKNYPLHSVEELLLIPGFDSWVLFGDHRTQEMKDKYESEFLTDEEKSQLLTENDYILENHITTYIPINRDSDGWKININRAPYHVILSLSEFMTPDVAQDIIDEKGNNKGSFGSLDDLSNVASLHLPAAGGTTVLETIQNNITFQDRLFKIIVTGVEDDALVTIEGIYDARAKKLVRYLE